MNEQVLRGHWNELKGEIQQRWGQLTSDELGQFEGDANELVGLIQQRTGETRETIESFLEDLAAETSTYSERAKEGVGRAREAASQFAHDTSERFREEQERLTENVRQGYAQAEQAVRRKPAESLAIAFGVGLVSGLVVGLMLKSSK